MVCNFELLKILASPANDIGTYRYMIQYNTYDKYLSHILDRSLMIYAHNLSTILFSRINSNVNVYILDILMGNVTSDPKLI